METHPNWIEAMLKHAREANVLGDVFVEDAARIDWTYEPLGSKLQMEQLGWGQFGTVWKTTATNSLSCALKFLHPMSGNWERMTELRVLQNIQGHDSAHIVKYYESFQLRLSQFGYITALSMELCDGSLRQLMTSTFYEQLTPELKSLANWDIVEQVATGLSHCHSISVMHRDIKPENKANDESDYQFKLGDFGFARVFSRGSPVSAIPDLPLYMAPELANNDHDYRVDLYNLGHVMLELGDCIGANIAQRDPDFWNLSYALRRRRDDRPSLDRVLHIARRRLQGRNITPLPGVIADIMAERTGEAPN